MSVNLVFGLGFTSEYIIRIIANRGISDVKEVYLFSVWNVDEFRKRQSEETINTVMKVLSAAGVKEIRPKYLNIDTTFDDIVLQIAEVVRGENLEFYLIGGMRVLNLALYYYAMLAQQVGKKVKILSFTEDMEKRYELPAKIPRKIGENHVEILRLMSDEKDWEIENISKQLGKSLSTISKQISDLEEENYIECKLKKPKICRITNLGKIIVELANSS
ncbi:CRISPR-associated transcriptional regulator Csa3 [Sulfurisphaera javensis]|uniref:CRISPR-associated transcriptional regulator Csa3 n=1 Tax=Sulfurisphaera javensis TaxID=2049879 RepID=A0AAT9GUV9_9CREN